MAAYMQIYNINRKPKIYHNIRDHVDIMTDDELYERYRFHHHGVAFLDDLLQEHIPHINHNRGLPIPPKIQILCFLRYVASGSFQQVIGDTLHISQPSVNRAIWNVCDALLTQRERFICWPDDRHNERSKQQCYNEYGLPGTIGALDGTHIRIMEPSENGNAFINRKRFPSINVMGVCNLEGKFISMSVKWPGSCHDSFILRDSALWNDYENIRKQGIILGDSAYPSRKWLLTPFDNPANQHQQAYNDAQSKARSVIERTFGRFKRRFAMMHQEIRVSPDRACKLIAAAMILYNIAIEINDEMPDNDDFENAIIQHELYQGENIQSGLEMRQRIVDNFF